MSQSINTEKINKCNNPFPVWKALTRQVNMSCKIRHLPAIPLNDIFFGKCVFNLIN